MTQLYINSGSVLSVKFPSRTVQLVLSNLHLITYPQTCIDAWAFSRAQQASTITPHIFCAFVSSVYYTLFMFICADVVLLQGGGKFRQGRISRGKFRR